jgi:hypothetical protein
MSVHDRKGGAIRIRCSTARESGSCSNTGYYRLDQIEQAVIGQLAEHLAQPPTRTPMSGNTARRPSERPPTPDGIGPSSNGT